MNQICTRDHQEGFTLVELLVALALTAAIANFIVGGLPLGPTRSNNYLCSRERRGSRRRSNAAAWTARENNAGDDDRRCRQHRAPPLRRSDGCRHIRHVERSHRFPRRPDACSPIMAGPPSPARATCYACSARGDLSHQSPLDLRERTGCSFPRCCRILAAIFRGART